MNIYVGNLPYSAKEDQIRELFAQYGDVQSVKLVADRDTGRMKGFGFVEMSDDTGARAIEALDNFELNGRSLKVNEARPREERPAFNRAGAGGYRSR
ncbi:MAG: RNA recognition motif domain-containing protein [Chloroflexota bacterium]